MRGAAAGGEPPPRADCVGPPACGTAPCLAGSASKRVRSKGTGRSGAAGGRARHGFDVEDARSRSGRAGAASEQRGPARLWHRPRSGGIGMQETALQKNGPKSSIGSAGAPAAALT